MMRRPTRVSEGITIESNAEANVRYVHHVISDAPHTELKIKVSEGEPFSNMSDLSLLMLESIDPGILDSQYLTR